MICFYGWEGGVLQWGAKVLGTAAALEDAVQRYAQTPMPTAVLKTTAPIWTRTRSKPTSVL